MASRLVWIVAMCIAAGSAGAGEQAPAPPSPVPFVDLERYVGTWHQIALIPNRFQKQCVGGTTATYTLREDGEIEVVNRCRTADGSEDVARGVAKAVDPVSKARLRVSFVSFLGIRPFWGDYWVLALGDDYEYALVGTENRKYGWVLSRTPEPPPGTLEAIWDAARNQGYDPADFVLSPP